MNNKLSRAKVERLALLIEECAEVQKVACKILRHGYDSYNPDDIDSDTNKGELEKELGHLEYAIELIISAKDISITQIAESQGMKRRTIKQYLHCRENKRNE